MVDGRIKSAGVTFFTRGGKTIVRSATSRQPKRRTEKQFIKREGFAHNLSLWNTLSGTCDTLLTARSRPYDCFMSLGAKLPPVFLTRHENACGMALLMPGIPVSCGTLTDIVYRLGSVGSSPALLTSLMPDDMHGDECLLLVTLRQILQGTVPRGRRPPGAGGRRIRRRPLRLGAGAPARRTMLDADHGHRQHRLPRLPDRRGTAPRRRELRRPHSSLTGGCEAPLRVACYQPLPKAPPSSFQFSWACEL